MLKLFSSSVFFGHIAFYTTGKFKSILLYTTIYYSHNKRSNSLTGNKLKIREITKNKAQILVILIIHHYSPSNLRI